MSYEPLPDPNYVVGEMIRATGIPEEELPPGIGLVGLARLAKPPQIPEGIKDWLSTVDPGLLARLEIEQARQQRKYDLNID